MMMCGAAGEESIWRTKIAKTDEGECAMERTKSDAKDDTIDQEASSMSRNGRPGRFSFLASGKDSRPLQVNSRLTVHNHHQTCP